MARLVHTFALLSDRVTGQGHKQWLWNSPISNVKTIKHTLSWFLHPVFSIWLHHFCFSRQATILCSRITTVEFLLWFFSDKHLLLSVGLNIGFWRILNMIMKAVCCKYDFSSEVAKINQPESTKIGISVGSALGRVWLKLADYWDLMKWRFFYFFFFPWARVDDTSVWVGIRIAKRNVACEVLILGLQYTFNDKLLLL